MSGAYKDAGVDVEAGYRGVALIKEHARRAARPEVISGVGGFGGLFSAAELKNLKEPVLVSGTDGVGTKLGIAQLMGKHATIGIDCVAMCVNDIVCSGAEPLFFLDYIAIEKNVPELAAEIVSGIADGCRAAGCALIGGETAEHPGVMRPGEYDVAGFAVGVVEKEKIVDGSRIKAGDKIIGVASSGVHSNGFSLIRKALNVSKERLDIFIEALGGKLGDVLLEPTKIYVKPALNLIDNAEVLGIAHITGGGLIENIPRVLPAGLKAVIDKSGWAVSPVFSFIAETGGLDINELYGVFNMGVGMVFVTREDGCASAVKTLEASGEKAFIIGEVAPGKGIEIC